MNVEYRAPGNQAELEDCLQCVARAFGGSLSFFTNIVQHDPWFCLDNTRACFLDGKAVSVVQIFDRPVRAGHCVVRMGGIGSVGTDPDHRRAGYSLNVLRDSVRYMAEVGYDISALFTGIPSHYARAGWVIYPVYSLRLTLPERVGEPHAELTVELYEAGRDLPELRFIYDRFNATRTGTLTRTGAYWDNLPKWREYDPALFWVARRNGGVVAYLKAGRWSLNEFGWLPGEEEAVRGLCLHFLRQAQSEGVKDVEAFCPSGFRAMFEVLGCKAQRREASFTMIQVINLESLLVKIAPLLEERIDASELSGWEGAVRIRYEAGEGGLFIKGGRITVSKPGGASDIDLVVSQTQLLRLLFGNVGVEDVAFSNRLALSGSEMGLLKALFPPDELFMWRTDGF